MAPSAIEIPYEAPVLDTSSPNVWPSSISRATRAIVTRSRSGRSSPHWATRRSMSSWGRRGIASSISLVDRNLDTKYLDIEIPAPERKNSSSMPVGDTYLLHDGERVTVRVAEPGLLHVEAEWAPSPHKPPVHRHPVQDERFEVHEGELTVQVDGRRQVLRAGDAVDVPRDALHKMWNSGDVPCRASGQGGPRRGAGGVRPALRAEGFFRRVHESREGGSGDEHGMLTLLTAAPILREFDKEFA